MQGVAHIVGSKRAVIVSQRTRGTTSRMPTISSAKYARLTYSGGCIGSIHLRVECSSGNITTAADTGAHARLQPCAVHHCEGRVEAVAIWAYRRRCASIIAPAGHTPYPTSIRASAHNQLRVHWYTLNQAVEQVVHRDTLLRVGLVFVFS